MVEHQLSTTYTYRGRRFGPTDTRVPREVALKDQYKVQRAEMLASGTPEQAIPTFSAVLAADRAANPTPELPNADGSTPISTLAPPATARHDGGTPIGATPAPGQGVLPPNSPGTDVDGGTGAVAANQGSGELLPDDFPYVDKLRAQGINTFTELAATSADALSGIGEQRWGEITEAAEARKK
jgi:hypothetical protein